MKSLVCNGGAQIFGNILQNSVLIGVECAISLSYFDVLVNFVNLQCAEI